MLALFPLGTVAIRPRAATALAQAGITVDSLLKRHARGDWGDVRARDRKQNVASVQEGGALVSAYTLETGVRVLVVTADDRSSTVALVAAEYGAERPAPGWAGAVLFSRRR